MAHPPDVGTVGLGVRVGHVFSIAVWIKTVADVAVAIVDEAAVHAVTIGLMEPGADVRAAVIQLSRWVLEHVHGHVLSQRDVGDLLRLLWAHNLSESKDSRARKVGRTVVVGGRSQSESCLTPSPVYIINGYDSST